MSEKGRKKSFIFLNDHFLLPVCCVCRVFKQRFKQSSCLRSVIIPAAPRRLHSVRFIIFSTSHKLSGGGLMQNGKTLFHKTVKFRRTFPLLESEEAVGGD